MVRRLIGLVAAVALLFALTAQAYADTQGSNPAGASGDKNLWLGIVVLVLLVGSLIVIRPRGRG